MQHSSMQIVIENSLEYYDEIVVNIHSYDVSIAIHTLDQWFPNFFTSMTIKDKNYFCRAQIVAAHYFRQQINTLNQIYLSRTIYRILVDHKCSEDRSVGNTALDEDIIEKIVIIICLNSHHVEFISDLNEKTSNQIRI
jgi:hypothetical protein